MQTAFQAGPDVSCGSGTDGRTGKNGGPQTELELSVGSKRQPVCVQSKIHEASNCAQTSVNPDGHL